MKRFTAILVIQFAVIFGAAFLGAWAFSHWRNPSPTATHETSATELSWFRTQLGVDAALAAKLETLHHEFEAEQSKLCAQHCATRFDLATLIKNNNAPTPEMDALSKKLSELEAESERATLRHIFAVGNQLNAVQREKFVAKVYNQMCSSCPMGMHRPAPDKQASCGVTGCGCCVASSDHTPVPTKPVAQSAPVQPRLDVFVAKAMIEFPASGLSSSPQFGVAGLNTSPPSPLFLLYSVFRI